MTTKTGGTNATTTLGTGVQIQGPNGASSVADADVAAVNNLILNDLNPVLAVPGAFSRMGLLYVPNRGVLKMQPGDWVFVGPDGFPYLVPQIALPLTLTAVCNGGTSGTPGTVTFAASVIPLGWVVGAFLSGTNVSGVIKAISADGKTVTVNTTGTPTGTMTAGSWTHS